MNDFLYLQTDRKRTSASDDVNGTVDMVAKAFIVLICVVRVSVNR